MTTFAERVKEIVRRIPKGSVMTYQAVALAAGNPRAYRAVASVMRRNYDVTISCHRVIKSDGTLGGYNRGGKQAKRSILKSEGYNC